MTLLNLKPPHFEEGGNFTNFTLHQIDQLHHKVNILC